MRIFIVSNLEGAAGVAAFQDDTYPDARFYARARTLLTAEVNAAVEGALEAGAREIVVWDGHGPGGLNPDEIHPQTRLLHGRGTPPNLLLDRGFDAVMFVGQHAMNHVPDGNLCHTYSSRTIDEMRLNGELIGEFGLRTYLAGYFGIPVILLTGDAAACREAKELVSNIVTVAVKEGISRNLALSVSPKRAREMIREGAARAVQARDQIQPVAPPPPPYTLQVRYLAAEYAEAAMTPESRRVNSTTVAYTSIDFLKVAR